MIKTHSLWASLLAAGLSLAAVADDRPGQMLRWREALPALTGGARVDALLQLADGYRALGRLQDAFAALEEALALVEREPDPRRRALTLAGLSDAWLLSRRLDEATDLAEQSVAAARGAQDPRVTATALNHLGNAYLAEQRPAEALGAYREGLDLAGGEPGLAVALALNAVHAHLADGAREQAAAALDLALTRIHALPASRTKAFDLVAAGHLAQRLGEAPAAEGAFHEARALAERLGDVRARSYAAGHLGELRAAAGRLEEAEALLDEALFLAQQSGAPELIAGWQRQLGRLYAAQGRSGQAKAAYRHALDTLRDIQPALVFGRRGQPEFFRDSVGAVYLEFAELLLDEAAAGEPQRQRTLRQARAVMEDFKAVELKNYFQDECVAIQQERNRTLEIDSLITPGAAVLYPIILPERTVLLLSRAGGDIRQFEAAVGAAELTRTVTDYREQLTRPGNPRRLRQQGLALYRWLIEPLEREIEGIHTLVIVPDGILRTIPFAALFDGRRFLVERYALALTPGLTLTDPESFPRGGHRVLLTGLSEGAQGYSGLPHVVAEINAVAAHLGRDTRLIDAAFLKERVRRELGRTPYSVISFATHSQFHRDPHKNFLLTYDQRITLDELDRYIRLNQFRDEPVDLLVLSACNTAQGDERAALGLAGAAVKAGARSVVASLWSVNDAAAAALMPAFFEALEDPARSKAQALQQAQQQLLADPRYRHPSHWAAFVLIGNWF